MSNIDVNLVSNFKTYKQRICFKIFGIETIILSAIGTAIVYAVVGAVSAFVSAVGQTMSGIHSRTHIDKMRRERKWWGWMMSIITNGHLLNTRSSNDPIKIPYGILRMGGTWVYSKPSRANNNMLNTIISWGEGEVEGLHTAIDYFPVFSGTTTLNDLHTSGEFSYSGCTCDMSCDGYATCSCNMSCHSTYA